MKSFPKQFGLFLKKRRLELGLSQKQVSQFLGYPNIQSVSNWERGKTLPPLKKLKRISSFYKLSKNDLISRILAEIEAHMRRSF